MEITCIVCGTDADHCCSGCGTVSYCGEECQRTDFDTHQQICSDSRRMETISAPLGVTWHRSKNIVGILTDERLPPRLQVSTLLSLVKKFNLVSTLSSDGPFTVFVPIDSAFAMIDTVVKKLNKSQVADVLKFHVVKGIRLTSRSLIGKIQRSWSRSALIPTILGQSIQVNMPGRILLSGEGNRGDPARIVGSEWNGTNGVIHFIDRVLIPDLTK